MSHTILQSITLALQTRWRDSKDQVRTSDRATVAAACLPGRAGRSGLNRLVDSVTPSDLSAVAEQLQAAGRGPATVNRYIAALRGALRAAHEEGWASPPPAYRSRREPSGRDFVPTEVQVRDLLRRMEAVRPLDCHRLAQFLHATGCRLGEALKLEVGDVATYRGRSMVTFEDTKSGRDRTCPVKLHVAQLATRYTFGKSFPVSRSHFQRVWAHCRDALGLPREFVPHSLRHGFVTRKLAAGVPLTTVAAYVGHTSTRTTERYAHPAHGDLLRCVEQS